MKGSRDMNIEMTVGAGRLDDQHGVVRIGGETIGEDTSG